MTTKPNKTISDIRSFRESLWKLAEKNSKGLTNIEIIRSMENITEDIYNSGIDDAYDSTRVENSTNLADLWDCIWLVAWVKDLRKIQFKKGIDLTK